MRCAQKESSNHSEEGGAVDSWVQSSRDAWWGMPFGLELLGMTLQRDSIGGRMPWAAIRASNPENDGNKCSRNTGTSAKFGPKR